MLERLMLIEALMAVRQGKLLTGKDPILIEIVAVKLLLIVTVNVTIIIIVVVARRPTMFTDKAIPVSGPKNHPSLVHHEKQAVFSTGVVDGVYPG